MDKQIEMLHQAYIIERKYMPDQVFSLHIPVRVTRELIEKEGSCSKEELQTMFQDKVLLPHGTKQAAINVRWRLLWPGSQAQEKAVWPACLSMNGRTM